MIDCERLQVPLLNSSIRNSQAMAWFEDRVVVGTARSSLGVFDGLGARSTERLADSHTRSRDEDGAQIVTFDPLTREWQKIYDSPLVVGADGRSRARDRSIRTALVCQTAADAKPCLYFGASGLTGNVAFLRSEDGCWIQECAGSGFNLEIGVPSVGPMACLRGRLFSSPAGRYDNRGVLDDGVTDYPAVLESADPMSGNWIAASEPGFGDPENLSVGHLAVFEDHLYAATVNPRHGFQLWKTDAAGSPPYRWRRIIDSGAWLGATCGVPTAIAVFGGAVYVGAATQRHRRQGLDRFGPFAAEMIRVHADEKLDLVTGKARFTPTGLKAPISGLSGGFGDLFTYAFSHMAVHDGWLYAGTTSWRWLPGYLRDRTDLSPERLDRLRAASESPASQNVALWRTADGVVWQNLTEHGLPEADPQTYGIRELLATPHGLFVAPSVAGRGPDRARGPIDLWWGQF